MNAVRHHWGFLVTSNSTVGGIALYEHFAMKLIPDYLLWIGVCLSILFAFFLAWRDERRKVEQLETKIEDRQKKIRIGSLLSDFYTKGLALKAEIVNSTDDLSVDESKAILLGWSDDLVRFVQAEVSAARALQIVQIECVEDASISGMKSDTTLEAKTYSLLYHTERLKRLSELLKEY